MDRKRFKWDVVVAAENGETKKIDFANLWSPEKVEPLDIAVAAAADLGVSTKRKWVPVSATLIG